MVLMHVTEQNVLGVEADCYAILREDEFTATELTRTQACDHAKTFLQIPTIRVHGRTKVLVNRHGREGGAVDHKGWISCDHPLHLCSVPFWQMLLKHLINRPK